jgi:DNA gyrase/topoisomerase IV subunit A
MQVSDLSKRSESDLKKSIADNKEKVRALTDDLNHVDNLMVQDLLDLKNKYGRPRRTKVVQELDTSGIISISNGVVLYTRNALSVFDLSNVLNKRAYLDFKAVKIDDKWVKELVGYHPISSDVKSVLVFYSDGTASPVTISLIDKWLADMNWEKHGFIRCICPIYESLEGTVVCITSEGQVKRFDPKEVKAKNVNIGTVVESCLFVPKSQDDQMLILMDEKGFYRYFELSEVRETGRTSQGITTGFDNGDLRMAVTSKDSTHAVIMVENFNGEGLCHSIELEAINKTTRTSKLKKIFPLEAYNFSGIGVVNLNVKDQIIVFYTKSLIATCSGRALKNMKSLRKLSSNKSFGLMDVIL